MTAVPAATAASTLSAYVSGLTDTTVTLSWGESGDFWCFNNYEVQWRPSGAPTWNSAGTFSSRYTTTVAVTGLQARTAYDFQVIDNDCFGSAASNTVTATTKNGLTLAVTGTATDRLQVSWNESDDPPSCFWKYNVFYRVVGAPTWYSSPDFTSKATTSTTIVGLERSTHYELKVSEFDCWGTRGSPAITATTSSNVAQGTLGGGDVGAAIWLGIVGALGAAGITAVVLFRRGGGSRATADPDAAAPSVPRAPAPPVMASVGPREAPSITTVSMAPERCCAQCGWPLRGVFCGRCGHRNE